MKWLSYKYWAFLPVIAIAVVVAGCTSVKTTNDTADSSKDSIAILHIAD